MTGPVAAAAYTGSVYRTLADFYAARPARKTSPEADYGVHWAGPGPLSAPWRVSYVQDTGEIYATQGNRRTEVLGWVQPDPDHRNEPGGNPAGPTYYETLDRILAGWAELGRGERKLSWVQLRLESYLREASRP